MTKQVFSESRLWRQVTSSLTVKSLNRFDNGIPFTIPSSLQHDPLSNTYSTLYRSPYSVVRSRNTPPNVCAQDLIPPNENTASSRMSKCCCAALLYRVVEQAASSPSHAPEQDRQKDDFVFALKLASVEQMLRELVGEDGYKSLVGSALAQAWQVGLCQDLPQLSDGESAWVARLLLTPEEDHRVNWLREDGVSSPTVFGRMPSFKALYVAYHASDMDRIDVQHLEAIEARMRTNKLEWDMSDAAVACEFSTRFEKLRPYFSHVVRDVLLREVDDCNTEKAPVAKLRHILGALLLLQCFRQMHHEAVRADGNIAHPPTYLFEAATQLFTLAARLPSDELAFIFNTIAKSCRVSVLSLVSICNVSVDDPELREFTLWLLKEAPTVPACQRHFSRMVQRSQTEALALLEECGLLSTRHIDLRVVVTKLLPLLNNSGNEDFFFLVIREVLTGMEERVRRHAHSFTDDDVRCIAALGTRLFEGQYNHPYQQEQQGHHSHQSSGVFDSTARAQLEELQVMDGSPWALMALSYNYLKEIVRALFSDHRQLKKHVQDQVRNIVEAVKADTSGVGDSPPPSASPHTAAQNFAAAECSTVNTGKRNCAASAVSKSSNVSNSGGDDGGGNCTSGPPLMRLSMPLFLRERFVIFVEDLVKALVDETGTRRHNCRVVSNELCTFVSRHISLPNIHDEYRRKIFLLVNVVSETNFSMKGDGGSSSHTDCDSNDDIPAELRLLVTSLPLTLSPWASVMILREVLSESSGRNPRYTYVLNAAIDLQLPISTTRSRIATTLNMWRFLNSQADKLTVMDQVAMKRRCVLNLPLAYILSSYWSLLTWLLLMAIVGLNVVGMDFESQYVATRLFREFVPPEGTLSPVDESWSWEGASQLTSLYLENNSPSNGGVRNANKHWSSSELLFSSASYLFLGTDDQRHPMTLISINGEAKLTPVERAAQEYASASALLQEFSMQLSFPFYLAVDQQLSMELIIARVAERVRRVSFNNAWFVSRAIFRTFPLGRHHSEYSLVSHTCAQANLTRRRITFLLYFHRGVPLPPKLLTCLHNSVLAQNGNLIVLAHGDSLSIGGSTVDVIRNLSESTGIRYIPYSKEWVKMAVSDLSPPPSMLEGFFFLLRRRWREVVEGCRAGIFLIARTSHRYVRKCPSTDMPSVAVDKVSETSSVGS